MKTPFLTLLSVLTLCGALPGAERAALIIGNDAYPAAPLENAVKDATAIQGLLRDQLGFAERSIVFGRNLDRVGVFEKVEDFKKVAAGAEIVLLYYAGHGMESLDGKENFLIPVDADIAQVVGSEAALRAGGVNLLTLMNDIAEVAHGAKVVLMDCCRERPAGRGMGRAGGGLVTYEDGQIPADTLMILAAAPRQSASDGANHGPFTMALLETLPKPEQNLLDAFFAVSDRVQSLTEKQQVPWMKFDGSGKIFREQAFLQRGVPVQVVVETPGPATGVGMPAGSVGSQPGGSSPVSSGTPFLDFENTQGMAFRGRLLSVSHEAAMVERTDGQRFEIPLAQLTPATIKRVKDFQANAPPANQITAVIVDKMINFPDNWRPAGVDYRGYQSNDEARIVFSIEDSVWLRPPQLALEVENLGGVPVSVLVICEAHARVKKYLEEFPSKSIQSLSATRIAAGDSKSLEGQLSPQALEIIGTGPGRTWRFADGTRRTASDLRYRIVVYPSQWYQADTQAKVRIRAILK